MFGVIQVNRNMETTTISIHPTYGTETGKHGNPRKSSIFIKFISYDI